MFLAFCLLFSADYSVLDPQPIFDRQTFWDNRDWDWYRNNIPLFDCPDPDLMTTYYYRWELITKHLTYGSPRSGYSFTEFIDRPFWSGTYGAISCPAGLQLYEVRWLRDPRYAWDYFRYWYRTPGAQPRRYSTWLADAGWAVHLVHPNANLAKDLLPDMVKNYQGWEARHFDADIGLFWQTGHDDGMEYNINSRQTQDLNRGAPGYRPTLNSYLWADANAIAKFAVLAGDTKLAGEYRTKSEQLKKNIHKLLFDANRQFFFHLSKNDEERDGFKVRRLTFTHASGQFEGSPHGRELIGFVPWQFNLPDFSNEKSWRLLMEPSGFFAPYGPTTVERNDPMFRLSPTCCWWSGQSWPYATSQTLKAAANLIHNYKQSSISNEDYFRMLDIYSRTHRKNGKPYLAEAANPFTGSFEGHDNFNHSEHYFHSSFNDLVITGLCGLQLGDDAEIKVAPLIPQGWDYFALDGVPFRGRTLTIIWDRTGERYRRGKGLTLLVNGSVVANAPERAKLSLRLDLPPIASRGNPPANFAVNNDGNYYPKIRASHTGPGTSITKLVDGNYWYHLLPPNRWTSEGSARKSDWCEIDFGTDRIIDTVKLYPLDDGSAIAAPAKISLEVFVNQQWIKPASMHAEFESPIARRANVFRFDPMKISRIRATLEHQAGRSSGLSEIEAWGPSDQSLDAPTLPVGNIAARKEGAEFPKATASFTSRFDQASEAIDGKANFAAEPRNRWTSYESPNATDWLEIDFGSEKTFSRVEIGIYDDRGGVRAPKEYQLETWTNNGWRSVADQTRTPGKPVGGQYNEVVFPPVSASKLRINFTHAVRAKSGVTEVLVFE